MLERTCALTRMDWLTQSSRHRPLNDARLSAASSAVVSGWRAPWPAVAAAAAPTSIVRLVCLFGAKQHDQQSGEQRYRGPVQDGE